MNLRRLKDATSADERSNHSPFFGFAADRVGQYASRQPQRELLPGNIAPGPAWHTHHERREACNTRTLAAGRHKPWYSLVCRNPCHALADNKGMDIVGTLVSED